MLARRMGPIWAPSSERTMRWDSWSIGSAKRAWPKTPMWCSSAITATLLGLLGAGDLGEVSGKDWSAPLKGQGRATDRDVAWTDTWYHNANRAAVWTADMQCQRDFGSVNLDDAFVDACYHRDKDPEFLDPITNAGLMERLGQWRADRPVVGKPAAAKTPKGKPPVKQGKAKGKAPAKSGKVKAPVD